MAGGGRKSGCGRNDYLHQFDRLWTSDEFWLQFIEAADKIARRHGLSRARGPLSKKEIASMLNSDCGISVCLEQMTHLMRMFSFLKCQVERGPGWKPLWKLDFATPPVIEKMREYLQEHVFINASNHGEDGRDLESDLKRDRRHNCCEGHGSVTTYGSFKFPESKARRSARNANKPKPKYCAKERAVIKKLPVSSIPVKRKQTEGQFLSRSERREKEKKESETDSTVLFDTLSDPWPSERNELEMNNVRLMDEEYYDLQVFFCDILIPTEREKASERLTLNGTMRVAKRGQLSIVKDGGNESDICYAHRAAQREFDELKTNIVTLVKQKHLRVCKDLNKYPCICVAKNSAINRTWSRASGSISRTPTWMDKQFGELQVMFCENLIPTARKYALLMLTSNSSSNATLRAAKRGRLSFAKDRDDEDDNCYAHHATRREFDELKVKIIAWTKQTHDSVCTILRKNPCICAPKNGLIKSMWDRASSWIIQTPRWISFNRLFSSTK